LLEKIQPVGILHGEGFQARLRTGQLDAQRLDAPHAAQLGEQRPQQCTDHERGEHGQPDEDSTHRCRCAR
jgi:hypothetical protein